MQILDALEYSHQEGVIHQDIKPANIIIDERSKRPFVVDFGIAHSSIVETDASKFIMGTPLYMAPEQIVDTLPDRRSDIYASGMVLFELLAGKLPIQTTKADQLILLKQHNPDSLFTCKPSGVNPMITADLEKIILKAIAAVPDDRYQSCSDFRHDLESVNATMK
jgi:serine/threonine-protein kinase